MQYIAIVVGRFLLYCIALYYNALHAITLQCHGIVVVRYLLYCLSCNKTKSHGNIFSNSTALHYIVLHYIYITLQWAGIVVVRFLLYCLPCNKTKSGAASLYYLHPHRPNHRLKVTYQKGDVGGVWGGGVVRWRRVLVRVRNS